jgi:hypothetical protein
MGFGRIVITALAFCLSIIFSDLPSPAEASNETTNQCLGFAQAGNRLPLFGIMLWSVQPGLQDKAGVAM